MSDEYSQYQPFDDFEVQVDSRNDVATIWLLDRELNTLTPIELSNTALKSAENSTILLVKPKEGCTFMRRGNFTKQENDDFSKRLIQAATECSFHNNKPQ